MKRTIIKKYIAAAALLGIFTAASAWTTVIGCVDAATASAGSDEAVVSVAFPVVSEEDSPFDFIIDPQCLIYETDAARYGGGKVEENATVLFHNQQGEYNFSKRSDMLTVKNQSSVPVRVTITASLDQLGAIEVIPKPTFGADEVCSMYMAITDDEGNERAIFEKDTATLSIEMKPSPDSYAFGLTASCNPLGRWQNIAVHPRVKVTWKAEAIPSEKTVETEAGATTEIKVTEETAPVTQPAASVSQTTTPATVPASSASAVEQAPTDTGAQTGGSSGDIDSQNTSGQNTGSAATQNTGGQAAETTDASDGQSQIVNDTMNTNVEGATDEP